MQLLPENFNPGICCEQRAQLLLPNGDIITLDWNPETKRAVFSWKFRYLEFQNSNITLREVFSYLGYPVVDIEIEFGSLNSENILDCLVRKLPLCQIRLTEKSQHMGLNSFIKMLHEYRDGNTDLYNELMVAANGILYNTDQTICQENCDLLTQRGFQVRTIIDDDNFHIGFDIETTRESIQI